VIENHIVFAIKHPKISGLIVPEFPLPESAKWHGLFA
jgi:hypothetical protein